MQKAVIISFFDSKTPDAKPIAQANAAEIQHTITHFEGEKIPGTNRDFSEDQKIIAYRLTEDVQFARAKSPADIVRCTVTFPSGVELPVVPASPQQDYKAGMLFRQE